MHLFLPTVSIAGGAQLLDREGKPQIITPYFELRRLQTKNLFPNK